MIKSGLKILLLIFVAAGFSCTSDEGPSLLGFSDETGKAVELIKSANEDLKEIKKLYKANESGVEDIKLAMKEQNVDEVKKIANAGVDAINKGMALGKTAVEKLNRAERMKINKNFKDYIDLKEKSLRKLMEAFEIRRQLAVTLRNGYDPEDDKQRELITNEFKEQDDKFKEIMDEAREASRKANDLAKEATQEQLNDQ
ncbi:MAG: hypothetical protein R2747_20725 [Pyrinomonadaceae bacterium]